MAASKEARVPFVTKKLISYMYRKPCYEKISSSESKLPIRAFAEKLQLCGALNRKKIGFSAKVAVNSSRKTDYNNFRQVVRGALEW
jgi:asparagine synthase (glutamine-hydrolysing)